MHAWFYSVMAGFLNMRSSGCQNLSEGCMPKADDHQYIMLDNDQRQTQPALLSENLMTSVSTKMHSNNIIT